MTVHYLLRTAFVALATVLVLISACDAATIQGQLTGPKVASSEFSGALVSLNYGEYDEYVRMDGSFEFQDVVPGVYALSVHTPKFQFPGYRVEVKSNGSVRGLEVQGNKKTAIRYPLTLQSLGKPAYFEKRQQMSLYSMFANPMGIMMIFTLAIVVFFPKMMDSIDPEEMKKMQEEMKGSNQNPNELLSNLLGGGNKDNDGDDSD